MHLIYVYLKEGNKLSAYTSAGVIWKGDSLIDGVPETLDMLRSKVCLCDQDIYINITAFIWDNCCVSYYSFSLSLIGFASTTLGSNNESLWFVHLLVTWVDPISGSYSFFLQGKRLVFVTNNSTKSRKQYGKKFETLGLSVNEVSYTLLCWSSYSTPVTISNWKYFLGGDFCIIFCCCCVLEVNQFPKR